MVFALVKVAVKNRHLVIAHVLPINLGKARYDKARQGMVGLGTIWYGYNMAP